MTRHTPGESDSATEPGRFDSAELAQFIARLFAAAGVGAAESNRVAGSLVDANLCGHDSHGVIRADEYIGQLGRGELQAGARFSVLNETPALVAADGGWGFGQVQCRRLVELVADKARAVGIACGTLRQCGHIGRLGEWTELVAGQGLAGLISVNDNGVARCVAPPGGIAARISTNPLSMAVPTSGGPFVLDLSTSAVANGKVKLARLAGRACPPGWLQDGQGRPTTDPHVLLADPPGTLLPFGGDQAYKAFGLGLMLDLLVGGLSGGFCPPAPDGVAECNNVLLVVWDPARAAGRSHFLGEVDKLLGWVRDTPLAAGCAEIRLPGDRAAAVRQERLQRGVPLAGDTCGVLAALARALAVPFLQPRAPYPTHREPA